MSIRKQSLLCLSTTLGVLTFSASTYAATMEEVVVRARAEEQSVRDIPVALTAVGEERMDQFALESMMDLEAITPQLSIGRATSGSGTSISIRGIASTPTSIGIEQSVAVVIDGVYFPQGRTINEGLFDTRTVSIMKGPQALYFGKNATAGVISVATNNPGDELEVSLRVNNEFETEDLTLEGIISWPVNDMLGIRLAVQASDMEEGWIKNNGNPNGDIYTTFDVATGNLTSFPNPKATEFFPKEETFYSRLTLAGDLSDNLSYNVKYTHSEFEQAYTGGGELFDCPTLGGTAHASTLVNPQPAGRQTPLFEPIPLPSVDCQFDGSQGWNDVPPAVAAVNPLLNQFGNGDSGEEYESDIITATVDWGFENFDLTAVVNWHEQTTKWVGDQDGGDVTSIFAAEENSFENFSVELRAVTSFDQPVNFVIGAYYQDTNLAFDQDVIFANLQYSLAPNPHDEFTAYNKLSETDGKTTSIYGEIVWDISDRLELTAGLRYHDEEKDSWFIQPYVNPAVQGLFTQYIPGNPATRPDFNQQWDEVIPEVTLRWEATDNMMVYAAYKEGFKSGGFSNSAILSNLSPPGFLDFVFEPESVDGFEVGMKGNFLNGSMLVTTEVFFYEFEDLQVDFFNSQQFAYVTENAGGSETYGAEVQADWASPIEGLTFSGSFGYLKSEFTEFENFCYTGQTPADGCGPLQPGQVETDLRQDLKGNTRPGAPEWSGYLAANYETDMGDGLVFGMTANLQYKDETVLSSSDPNATFKAYTTYDANIRIGAADGKWQVALIGKNLSNRLAIRGAGLTPGTGGNTGTAEGFRADFRGGAIRGRQIEVEFRYRLF